MLKVAPSAGGWFEVLCRVDAETYPALEEILERADAQSITLTDGNGPSAVGERVLTNGGWSSFEVRALFSKTVDRVQLVEKIEQHLPRNIAVDTLDLRDRHWDAYWKEKWQPRVFTNGLCVCPRWRPPPPEAKHVIFIDPGRAFGTGMHETTSLCLDWLAGINELSGSTVVDYGCGSGILAIAAGRLGAADVYAVDIDQDALGIAKDNATYNGVKVFTGVPKMVEGLEADIILANILLSTLEVLESRFAKLLQRGSRIALSGILGHQVSQVTEAYREHFRMEKPVVRGEWNLLIGHRR